MLLGHFVEIAAGIDEQSVDVALLQAAIVERGAQRLADHLRGGQTGVAGERAGPIAPITV